MLEDIENTITHLAMDQLGRNLAGCIPSRSRNVHHNAVAMATALATAHWTFSSYGRLEAERVNQFWWNLVYNSKFGQQWVTWSNIIFFKFKMADGRCWKIFEMPMDRLGRNLGGRIPSCSQYWKCYNSSYDAMESIGTTLGSKQHICSKTVSLLFIGRYC